MDSDRTPTATDSPVSPLSRRVRFLDKEEKSKPIQNADILPSIDIAPPLLFGGVPGTLLLMVTLPVLVFGLNAYARLLKGETITDVPKLAKKFLPNLVDFGCCSLVVITWLLVHCAFYRFFPLGRLVEGRFESYMSRVLLYKCNGIYALVFSLAAVVVGHVQGGYKYTWLISQWLTLLLASTVISFVISVLLYVKARWARAESKSDFGNTGHVIYDFFMGRETNPRWMGIDFKFVFELRPGLIGWVVFVSMLFIRHGMLRSWDIKQMSWSLSFITASQLIYVIDALWHESAILSTMDVIHEGFGWMLVFGDLVFVPFVFSLNASYVYRNPDVLPHWACVVPPVVLFVLGFLIMRSANSQKDHFRRCSAEERRKIGWKTVETFVRDRQLLADGWWGWARHANYTGDLLIAASWSAASGYHSLVPHVYLIYLTVLLVTRCLRDEQMCARKYGKAWIEYRELVPYRFIKGIW